MQCKKNKVKEIRTGLPPRKHSFNVISLTHIPQWVISYLALTFRTSFSTSFTCKQTFWYGTGLSSSNKSKLIIWSSKPNSNFFLPISTTQLAVNINGLPKIKGISLLMQAPLELVGLGSSSSMDSLASWKMNGSGMEKEEREEMPLQGEDESRRSSPP